MNINNAKTVKIFLIDGEPTGAKTVELSNWTGKAYLVPRNKLSKLAGDAESKKDLESQCVYLLIGDSEEGKQIVYVGEAENFLIRINQHNRNKEFWNLAICFITKDENLTKSHVKYLEAKIVEKIREADRVLLENSTHPSETRLPRPERAEMEVFLKNVEIVLSTMGLTFTQRLKGQTAKDIFFCKSSRANAKGTLTDEGFVVFKGSEISKEEVPSINNGLSILRFKAEKGEEFEAVNDKWILKEDKVFSSPSYAAGFVLGRNANGWVEWKTKSGKTLDEEKRQ